MGSGAFVIINLMNCLDLIGIIAMRLVKLTDIQHQSQFLNELEGV